MKIASLNIGKIQEFKKGDQTVTSGINKTPTNQRLKVGHLGIEGDEIADLTVHGGKEKAVYAYPFEHYQYWKDKLDRQDLGPGIFGENLTVTGYLEDSVYLGDVFKAGSATLQVTIPRQPCFKLNLKFNDNSMVKQFLSSGKSGYYFKVLEEGTVEAGNEFKEVKSSNSGISIADFNHLYAIDRNNVELLQKAIQSKYIPERYRLRFEERLNTLDSSK